MVAEFRNSPHWMALAGGVLAGVILMCLPEVWAGKLRGLVHDGLAPGQIVLETTLPQAIHAAPEPAGGDRPDSSWERQAHYWRAESARLKSELAELQQVPHWPDAKPSSPLVQPRLRTARVIGWERPKLTEMPTAVLRGGTSQGVQVDDLVLTAGEAILDQGETTGISADDLVLAGRSVVGRIQRTSRWTSTIQPVTDPEFRGQAQIVRLQDGEAILGAEGILTGGPEHICQLLQVDTTAPVTEGDLVFTSFRGVPLSPPLFYGTVTKTTLTPSDPYWSIEVTPARSDLPPHEVLVLELSLAPLEEP